MSAIIVSAFVAFAAFYAAFLIAGLVVESRRRALEARDAVQYEEKLLNRVRGESLAMSCFEPLVDAVRALTEKKSLSESFDHYLDLKGMAPPWNGSLYLAAKKVEAFLFAVVGAFIALPFVNVVASLLIGAALGFFYHWASVDGLKSEALEIKTRILRRLPFVVDLMALIRLANGSFVESLEVVARENADHPIGGVFARSFRESKFGKTQREVLEGLAERMDDPSFREVSSAIVQADELGQPVAATLSELAGQMRLKRQQWGEVLSGKAQVKIIYPGFVIMAACLMILLAPFILDATRNGRLF